MGIIKVAIADDHKIFRKGVVLSLRPYTNIKFVLEAENGEDLLAGIPEAQPDVVLMDLRMPGKDGIETTKAISKQYPNIYVIVLSMYDEISVVRAAMGAGVNGFVLKRAIATDMLDAIAAVLRGESYVSPSIRGSTPAVAPSN